MLDFTIPSEMKGEPIKKCQSGKSNAKLTIRLIYMTPVQRICAHSQVVFQGCRYYMLELLESIG